MRPIFNSLGSNYSFDFALNAFMRQFISGREFLLHELEKKLASKFNGQAFLFYKGRDAIEFSLRSFGVGKNDTVITQAFTCWAVEEGIKRTGAFPVFADLEKNSLNPSVQTLEKAFQSSKRPKALIVQHTLGYPAEMRSIRKWCNQRDLVLIEDLAQSYGAKDTEEREVGTFADAVVISFGRDKVIDAVSGGAAVIKNATNARKLEGKYIYQSLSSKNIRKDLAYPLLTWTIRNTYSARFGKLLHAIVKSIGAISSPITSPSTQMASLPVQYAELVLRQLARVELDTNHRRKIANYYQKRLGPYMAFPKLHVRNAINLRFPVYVISPGRCIECLAKRQIYLSDRWYRAAVDAGQEEIQSSYQPGSCPNAEQLAKHVMNLPTHRNTTMQDARYIVRSFLSCQNY